MKQIKDFLLTCLILTLQYNTHWAWKMPMVSQFPISNSVSTTTSVSSFPFQSIECHGRLQHHRQQQQQQQQRLILGLRGGSDEEDTEDEEEQESDNNDDDYDELEQSEEETEKDSSISNLDESQQMDDNNNEDDNEDNNEESKTSISSSPVKITLKTAVTNNPLIEQSIEITASPTRTVHSLKQSVSRQFKSKPPIESIQLRLDGQLLDDDETLVEDLIVEDDDDDEEEEEGEDHDGMPKLNIIVDMIPPVDPKFGTEMKDRLDHVTNEQLLEAYVVNLAAMHQNSIDVMTQTMESNQSAKEDNIDNEIMEEKQEEAVTSEPVLPVNLVLQKYATMMKSQIIDSLSEGEKKLLEKKDTPSSPMSQDDLDTYNTGDLLLKESIKRKKRRGGATINMKRVIQKNLNINWPDTIRNFLLFLFFGYFGGRNAMSRTIMLLGAPACFIIQARPVKIAMKQLFYTIGEPPGILLSLLPAPQQTIMSCDYNNSLKSIYGDEILTCNDAVTYQDVIDDDNDEEISTSVYDSDESDYSQDDDEYDSDY